MALNLADKKAIVAEVSEVASSSVSLAIADYRGLSVTQMTELRAKAREAGVCVRVVRNNLARRALESTDFDCVKESLVGPLVLMFSLEEPGSAAKLLKKFIKDNAQLEVKALALSGQLYSGKDLDAIAALPSRDEALSKLLSVMQAPISKFVRTLAEPNTKLVRVISAVKDQKQA